MDYKNKYYKNKYLKYKNKYLTLKNILGGASSASVHMEKVDPFYNKEVPGSYQLTLFTTSGIKKLKKRVNKSWPEVVQILKQQYDIINIYSDSDMNYEVTDITDEDFFYFFPDATVTLYVLTKSKPSVSVTDEHKQKAFAEWARKHANTSTMKSTDLGKFTDITDIDASIHAIERSKQRSNITADALKTLNDKSLMKYIISVKYTAPNKDGVPSETLSRKILVTPTTIFILSVDLGTIITLWEVRPTFNEWYKTISKK